jgi:hypothetical protein
MDKKKRIILIVSIVAVCVILAVAIVWIYVFSLPKPIEPGEITDDVLTETESDLADLENARVSLVDGTEIFESEEKMIAVLIENHGDSRRQMSGLGEASLVFEAETEGGITRFLAFYPYQKTIKVGPVRSVRPYYVRWAEQFDSAFAHAGGSDLGLNAIYTSGRILDLEGLALEGGLKYFTRDYSYYAPHNLFANLSELRELMDDREWDNPIEDSFVKFESLPELNDYEDAETVHIYYPFPQYFVRYDYDDKNQSYLRYQADSPHIDHATESQIAPSNIVVMITNYYPTDEEGRLYMKTEGSGEMYLFRNGKVVSGTWKKIDSLSTLKFYDEDDHELTFQPGSTWISVINYVGGLQWE